MTEAAPASPADVALRYFTAIGRHDLDAAVACWRDGGVDNLAPVGELRAPEGIREYFGSVFAAIPDFTYEVRDTVVEGGKVVVWWRIRGTFTGSRYDGMRATGAGVTVDGLDYVRVEDGLIVRNDSYWDDAGVARQLGLLPAKGSRQERVLKALVNARTRLLRRGRRR